MTPERTTQLELTLRPDGTVRARLTVRTPFGPPEDLRTAVTHRDLVLSETETADIIEHMTGLRDGHAGAVARDARRDAAMLNYLTEAGGGFDPPAPTKDATDDDAEPERNP